jgi:hypothetical protein
MNSAMRVGAVLPALSHANVAEFLDAAIAAVAPLA